jgi:hypothetical protein
LLALVGSVAGVVAVQNRGTGAWMEPGLPREQIFCGTFIDDDYSTHPVAPGSGRRFLSGLHVEVAQSPLTP